MSTAAAERVVARCRELARITDVPGETTRLFLSPATAEAHTLLSQWMLEAGLQTRIDDIGNVRGLRPAPTEDAPALLLFSHIDTVPNAGAFDGPLGVILGLEAIAALGDTPLPFQIELIAFSEEEGVRFAFPFLSSRAVVSELTADMLARTDPDGVTVAEAISNFGLRSDAISITTPLLSRTFAAIEVHIEQGPVLEAANEQIAVVHAIAGQSRLKLTFHGVANHAGTTPMKLRHDALVSAAEFITAVDRHAQGIPELVATVGRIEALPGAMNVVPGTVHLTLDVRHPEDTIRQQAVASLLDIADKAAQWKGVRAEAALLSEQAAVPMDAALTHQLKSDGPIRSMVSGAGHDAMILAPHVPTTMLFVRSPGGVSHNPAEDVRTEDVAAALETLVSFLRTTRPSN